MKIDVLIPSYRHFNTAAFTAISGMMNHSRVQGLDVECPALNPSSLVHRARNISITRLRDDSTHVLFCDDDMAPPKDALCRLLERKVPVVSGLCTTRELPPTIAAKVYDPQADRYVKMDRIRMGDLIDGPFGVGTGFLLVERGVLELALECHITGQDWIEENRRMFDRLHVRVEARERERARVAAIRKELWDNEQFHLVFRYGMQENGLELGEDLNFCRNLTRLGIPIAIDTAVVVGHIGDFPYSVHNLNDSVCEEVLV